MWQASLTSQALTPPGGGEKQLEHRRGTGPKEPCLSSLGHPASFPSFFSVVHEESAKEEGELRHGLSLACQGVLCWVHYGRSSSSIAPAQRGLWRDGVEVG